MTTKSGILLFLGAALAGIFPCVTASAAQISGRVTIEGTPPAEVQIDLSNPAFAQCAQLHKGKPLYTTFYKVGPNKGLGDVIVYISKGLAGKHYAAPKPQKEPVLDQKGCFYHPYVMAVQTNEKFKILNSDPFMHNVDAQPAVPGNQPFNIAQPIKGMSTEKSFSKPELFLRVKCDIHPWMFAYVCVMDNPFYAVTDTHGEYKFPDTLPPGTYTVTAQHRKLGKVEKQITVGADQKVHLDFTIPVEKK